MSVASCVCQLYVLNSMQLYEKFCSSRKSIISPLVQPKKQRFTLGTVWAASGIMHDMNAVDSRAYLLSVLSPCPRTPLHFRHGEASLEIDFITRLIFKHLEQNLADATVVSFQLKFHARLGSLPRRQRCLSTWCRAPSFVPSKHSG